jgi:hypothetical protein
MFDGRGRSRIPPSPPASPIDFGPAGQANSATLGTPRARPLTDAERQAILLFESQLFSAQIFDERAGRLDVDGARGGPDALPDQEYYFGINDVLGADPEGEAFDPVAMTVYSGWVRYAAPSDDDDRPHGRDHRRDRARGAVARGEVLFNTKPIAIPRRRRAQRRPGVEVIWTCTSCHDTPSAEPLRAGTAADQDFDPSGGGPDVSGLPIYTLGTRPPVRRCRPHRPRPGADHRK